MTSAVSQAVTVGWVAREFSGTGNDFGYLTEVAGKTEPP